MREVARERLVLEDGRQLYVEPVVLEASSRGDVLLAGTHNYVFEQDARGAWVLGKDDSIFGAVIPRTGPVQVIRSPVPTRLLNGVRAAAREDGKWEVVFSEVRPWTGENRPDTVARLWHGVLDGARWATLEQLPLPPERTVHSNRASSLARRGDTLAWAMSAIRPGHRWETIVYERRNGRWSYDLLPVSNSYTDLAYSDTLGLVLAAVQLDPQVKNDYNSLLFWVRDPDWRVLRSVISGKVVPVHRPLLRLSPRGDVLTWEGVVFGPDGNERRGAHAMVGRLEERNEPILVLDSLIAPWRTIPSFTLPGGSHLWVTDHLLPDHQQREIRFIREMADSTAVIGRIPNPFFTFFSVATPEPTEFLIVGGLLDTDQQVAASLLLRARAYCRADAS